MAYVQRNPMRELYEQLRKVIDLPERCREVPMRELYEQLRKVIDLPERCREVTIRVAMGEVPTVTATYFPDESKATGEPVTQRFTLTPIDEDNRSGVTAPASTYWQVQILVPCQHSDTIRFTSWIAYEDADLLASETEGRTALADARCRQGPGGWPLRLVRIETHVVEGD